MNQALINTGAKIESRNFFGNTPLHAAILRKAFELVPALIEAGAEIDARNERGTTPPPPARV